MGDYEIKFFDDPKLLEESIRDKAKIHKSHQSRLLATYD